ncbi:hypothetical protein ACEWY4_014773 [Coilia grayii]|uniref:Fcf2 pre-rRNA processing C-terminal domain-containing protein n=1 Tax=Coilia grayii TaxID=363190 RepID=A0ABD1JT67_9TELE
MVATRRGARVVESPTKTMQNESSSTSDVVISTRRSRRAAVHVEAQPTSVSTSDAQNVTSAASTEEDKPTQEATACVEDQPDDLHDADISDLESCCSAVSDAQTPSRRSTRRRGQPPATPKNPTSGTEGLSEAESCTSAVSATPGTATRRSTRSQRNRKVAVGAEAGDAQHSEAESCSSVVSLRKRALTRNQKKLADSQASHTEDTELSEHDSYDLRNSTVRKSTAKARGRRSKPVQAVPIDLDDSGDVSSSSVSRRTPGRRAKAAAAASSSSGPAPSAEDIQSGPSTRRSTRSRDKDTAVRATSDSESDMTGYSSLGSPGSAPGKSTPCSSRTGSASSNRAVPVSRVTRSLRVVVTQAPSVLTPNKEQGGEDTPVSGAMATEEKMEVQEPEKTVIVTAGDEETEKGGEDIPLVAAMETEEMEVQESETTVIVTGGDEESSLLADGGEEDKTLIAVEEEDNENDDAATRGVTVVDPAEPEFQENTRTASPTVTVSESVCPDTVEAAEIISAVHEHSKTEPSKGSVIVSGEVDEIPESSSGSSTILKTPCADRVTVAVVTNEAAEADSPEEVAKGDDKLLTATDATDLCGDQTAKVSVAEPYDSTAELDDDMAGAAEPHTATELDQTVKVTICAASESKEETVDDVSVRPDTSSLETATKEGAHQEDEEQTRKVCASDGTELNEDPEDAPPSSIDPEVSAQDGDQPSGSGASQKFAGVSLLLLESSDDEDEDSDACSLPEGGHGASESEGDSEEVSDLEEALTARTKSRANAQPLPSDGLFVIDTQPGLDPSQKYYTEGGPVRTERVEQQEEDEMAGEALGTGEDEEEFVDEEVEEEDEDSQVLFTSSRNPALKELSCRIDPGLKVKELGGLYISFDGSKSNKVSSSLKKLKDQKHLDELMKKSVIVPDFEKKDAIPPYKESMNALKLKRKVEREKTTGDGWFNMKAPEMTEELKNDLKALQMRSAMDPKRFYKKNDREGFAKYLQVGTVVDSPLDFYHSRIPKKERKRTIVEELLADAEFRSHNKKKYQEIMTERAALLAGKKHRKNKFKSK